MDYEIKDFFGRYVFGWMYSDVGTCEKNGANFGGVALICAYIDFMGKLYLGVTEGQTKERFIRFINDFFDDKYKQFSEFIFSDYRCGLLHQFFPRKGAGIVRGEENRGYHLVIDKENEIIPINLTVFLEDFKKAVGSYYEKLAESEQLKANFFKVYNFMRNERSESFKDLFGNTLTSNANIKIMFGAQVSGVTSSTIASGASLVHPDSYTSRMPEPIEIKKPEPLDKIVPN